MELSLELPLELSLELPTRHLLPEGCTV